MVSNLFEDDFLVFVGVNGSPRNGVLLIQIILDLLELRRHLIVVFLGILILWLLPRLNGLQAALHYEDLFQIHVVSQYPVVPFEAILIVREEPSEHVAVVGVLLVHNQMPSEQPQASLIANELLRLDVLFDRVGQRPVAFELLSDKRPSEDVLEAEVLQPISHCSFST